MSVESLEPAPHDEFARSFPGCTVTHLLSITTGEDADLALGALLAVKSSGGQVESLRLSRSLGGRDHQLRVSGLRPHQARVLSDQIAALPGVTSIRVEHLITR